MGTHTTDIPLHYKKVSESESNMTLLRSIIFLIPIFIFTLSLNCSASATYTCGASKSWRCSNCKAYQRQDDPKKGWQGEYKCTKCGSQR
jgi:hypothetical protein